MDSMNYWTTRRFARRRVLATGAAGTAALASMLTVGCGDDDDDPSPAATGTATTGTATTSTASATASSSPAATEPVRGGTLNVLVRHELAKDILTLAGAPTYVFSSLVYGGLLGHKSAVDWRQAFSYETFSDIAADWEQPDELTYTFKLNPAVKFQNKPPINGRQVTADDVVRSVERFLTEPKNTLKADYIAMDGPPTAIDGTTVQFKSKAPYAPFVTHLIAFRVLYVFPEELIADDEARVNTPVGSGPFTLKETREGSYWEFEANPTYHRKDEAGRQLPFLGGTRFNIVTEAAQELAQFAGGNIDRLLVTGQENLDDLDARVSGLNSLPTFATTYNALVPQQRSGPFQDVKLRRALSLAIDRDALLALDPSPGVWCNYVGPNMGRWYLDPQGADAGPQIAENVKHDPAEARRLLEAAGAAGQTFDFTYTPQYGDAHVQVGTVLVDQLRQAGFGIRPISQDYRTQFLQPGGKGSAFGEFDGLLWYLRGGYPHPSQLYSLTLKTGGTYSNHGANDPELDRMLDELGREFNEEAALEKSNDIQRYATENVFWIPTVQNQIYLASHSWVHGTRIDPLYEQDSLEFTWIDERG